MAGSTLIGGRGQHHTRRPTGVLTGSSQQTPGRRPRGGGCTAGLTTTSPPVHPSGLKRADWPASAASASHRSRPYHQRLAVKAGGAWGPRSPAREALSVTRGLAPGRRSGGRIPPGSYLRRASRADPVEPRGQDCGEPGQPAERRDQCQPAEHARHTRSVDRWQPGPRPADGRVAAGFRRPTRAWRRRLAGTGSAWCGRGVPRRRGR